MTQENKRDEWFAMLRAAVIDGSFVELSLSKIRLACGDLKSVDVRPIMVKRVLKLSFTYHYRTRDVVKNYPPDESMGLLSELLAGNFTTVHLCTTQGDTVLHETTTGYILQRHAASRTGAPELTHDRAKNRLIDSAGRPYLHALGISDAQGKIYKNSQDKFRQINKYIEIIDGLIKSLPKGRRLRMVDMGAGKGYLTFALYDYLTNTLQNSVEITGVEYRPDLVAQCNEIAQAAQFTGLRFVEGGIADYDCSDVDVVIALHACDTATDEAIAKAVQAGALLIVVAPCCHKQIRRAMDRNRVVPSLDFLMKYGTYAERISEMLTDGMRAQILELSGYRTRLFEFISGEHTPKNVMIVATKYTDVPAPQIQAGMRASLAQTKAQFGIAYHQLERLLD